MILHLLHLLNPQLRNYLIPLFNYKIIITLGLASILLFMFYNFASARFKSFIMES